MPELIAQGPEPQQRWRHHLEAELSHTIGRQGGRWSTPWDERVSRRHVEVVLRDGKLLVTTLQAAKNPVLFRGRPATSFTLEPGEQFIIGQTTFTFADPQAEGSVDLPRPTGEHTFTSLELRQTPFRHADSRIDALSRLPELIKQSADDEELHRGLVDLLLAGVDRAHTAAIILASPRNGTFAVDVLKSRQRSLIDAEFRPSRRLVRQAVSSGQSVVHVWNERQADKSGNFTFTTGADWAFCSPLEGVACAGLALYVAGASRGRIEGEGDAAAQSLRDDLKFAEVVATTVSGLVESRLLAARQASLGQFFSPLVLEAIGGRDIELALAPREADVTVLFCDLRGFSRESERLSGDLLGLLARVSGALGIMTHHILAQGGVIGDFHGDAAMGFWGWPVEQPDGALRACRAAIAIRGGIL